MGDYIAVTTTPAGTDVRPKVHGAINSGFYKKTDDPHSRHPSVVIGVDNIEKSVLKKENGGGRILGEPLEIPGAGMCVHFVDTEGNRLSILQPQMP